MLMRNVLSLSVLTGVLIAVQLITPVSALPYYISWATLFVAFGLVLFGAIAFLAFVGSLWARIGLVAAVPLLAQLILELVSGSNAAFPNWLLMIALPYAALALLGALLCMGVSNLRKRAA
jgi:hypothetical protein